MSLMFAVNEGASASSSVFVFVSPLDLGPPQRLRLKDSLCGSALSAVTCGCDAGTPLMWRQPYSLTTKYKAFCESHRLRAASCLHNSSPVA